MVSPILRLACDLLIVRQAKDGVCHPSFEGLIVHKLLEQLRIVLKDGCHYAGQGLVMLNAGILFVGMLFGVLVGRVSRRSPAWPGRR